MTLDWQHITQQHGPLVWQAVYRILQSHPESLDCCQDVMLEAYKRAQDKPIQNWPGFLRWLAVRRAIDRLRQRSQSESRIETNHEIELVATPSTSSSAALNMEELLKRLRSELASLPPQQSEAFWLRFVEQMSYVEIAEQLDIKTTAVGVLLHRARTRICSAISDLNPQSTE